MLAFITFVAINLWVDPYCLDCLGWQDDAVVRKPAIARHERIFKTVGLAGMPADIVILGTSRSDIGLDPRHLSSYGKALNLAMSNQPYRETRQLFEHTSTGSKPPSYIIGLDFFVSNANFVEPADLDVDNYAPERKWQLAISASTLADALLSSIKPRVQAGDAWTAQGWRMMDDDYARTQGNRKLMLASERGYLTRHYCRPPKCKFAIHSAEGKRTPLDELRELLRFAYHREITVKLLISPSHARQWEMLRLAGLWDEWEAWKRELVDMNAEEAKRAGRQSYPLWDFSGYNAITTEEVPPLDDREHLMRWYLDSSHYTTRAGELLLDRMLGTAPSGGRLAEDFGVKLTVQNIGSQLLAIRQNGELYRQSHKTDIQELESLATKLGVIRVPASQYQVE
ncbi:MAG: hypothetical protein PHI29_00425 [Gallionella sp.]|nr:hypothetical protein [Gallionella sp.]